MDGNDPIKRQKTAAGARALGGLTLAAVLHSSIFGDEPALRDTVRALTICPPSAYTRAIPSSIAVSATAFATTSATLLFNGDAMIFSAFSSLSGIMPAMA